MAEDTSACFLGKVPVTDASNKVMESALELLMVKLDNIQKKVIDKIVEKKHGTRLSNMSPIYQKLAAKLKKKGMDCTVGDQVNIRLLDTAIEMREPSSASDVPSAGNVIPFAEFKIHAIFNGRDSRSILAFVRVESHSTMTASQSLIIVIKMVQYLDRDLYFFWLFLLDPITYGAGSQHEAVGNMKLFNNHSGSRGLPRFIKGIYWATSLF